ncbi:hypothetical protein Esti_004155 [Eimeria stiedai]
MRVPHLLLLFFLLLVTSLTRPSQWARRPPGSVISFLLPPFISRTQDLGPPLRAAQEALGPPLQSLKPLALYRCCCWQPASRRGISPRGDCLWGGGPLGASYKGVGPHAVDAEEYLRLRNTVANLSDFQGGQELLQQREEELQQQQQALTGHDRAETYQRMRALRRKGRRQPKRKELHITARIAEADLKQKARQARAFLEAKHQVKMTLQLRGRERLSPENHLPLLTKLQQLLQDVAHATPPQLPASPCSVLALSLQPRRRQNKERNRESSGSS